MRIVIIFTLPLAFLLGSCSKEIPAMSSLPDVSSVRINLAFDCAHENKVLPDIDPDADALFRYARYLQKKQGPKDYESMAVYYRIAAAHGHYKANRNLQNLLAYGQAYSPFRSKEVIDLANQLIELGVPGGYYDIGHYLEIGYGLKQDREMALRFFRKAADLGSPDAQFYVGELLAPWDKAPEVSEQMWQCASDQGFAKASRMLGVSLQTDRKYTPAVTAFQQGVMAGDSSSAFALEHGFEGPPQTDRLYYLSLKADPERSLRYKQIGKFLRNYEHLNPKIPDIDQIVPLPPAKLPPWDGTFQWVREHDAAVPPEKPSEELVNRLSQAKNLDPATGLPLPPPPKLPLGTRAKTGQPCPESGIWCVPEAATVFAGATRHFRKGDVLPEFEMPKPRRLSWLDDLLGERVAYWNVSWKLISYDEKG
ncbi:sel1 repeat family protein [Ralstonia sp. 25mfcol4.1]|uniref:SEL1-like repeat protein n=1 Tax=Ralstonia sp. 25mfcol4.1 TaxID=1761899 RepID=UPI0020C8786C|nr:sel1 repeat family protein [Ralstonia sp. 25mfcol4.1]